MNQHANTLVEGHLP